MRKFGLAMAIVLVLLPFANAAPTEISARVSSTTVRQGAVVTLTVRSNDLMSQINVRFAGRSWPVYAEGPTAWRTILGTDPTTPPGRQGVRVEAVAGNGARLLARQTVTVVRVTFLRRRITFDPERQALLTPEAVARERSRVQAALSTLHPEQLWESAFAIPLEGPVSSPYGVLSIYQGVVRGFHSGTDIAAPEGTPVRAANHGIVRLAELLPLSGNAVMIDHGLGVVSSYLHMSSIEVTVGQRVAKEAVVGSVGSTGLATGPHLHWGLRVNGVRVDPLPWTVR